MVLYKVIVEQKITKIVIVEANYEEGAIEKASARDIIATEKTLEIKIDEFIPIEVEKY